MVDQALLAKVLWVELALLFAVIAALFGHSAVQWLAVRRREPPLAAARRALLPLIEGEGPLPADLPELRTLSTRLQVILYARLGRQLSGAARTRLSALAQQLGLVRRAEALCRSRFWWRRLRGVRLLTLFRAGEDAVPALLSDPHPVVRAEAVAWAAGFPRRDILDGMIEQLADPAHLCRFAAQDSLLRMRGAATDALAHYLSRRSGSDVEPALEVAAGCPHPRYLEPALVLCRDAEPGVRARAADVLATLGGEPATDALLDLFADPDPRVRAAAARGVGRLGAWTGAPRLAALLRDPAWDVRREAGLALRALGSPGLLLLRRARADADPFAADMARQVLDLVAISPAATAAGL